MPVPEHRKDGGIPRPLWARRRCKGRRTCRTQHLVLCILRQTVPLSADRALDCPIARRPRGLAGEVAGPQLRLARLPCADGNDGNAHREVEKVGRDGHGA